jgi:hypothetical protein
VAFTPDNVRRKALIQAAYDAGTRWVLGIDPDERLEAAAGWKLRVLTSLPLVESWSFRLRELYAPDTYRVDGIWGRKRQARLFRLRDSQFPLSETGSFDTRPLHQPWVGPGLRAWRSDINLYHLKMITPERRRARRDLYNALDPEGRYQKVGYDYLADESGAAFERIPAGREYRPSHEDDGGLWMAAPSEVGEGDRL